MSAHNPELMRVEIPRQEYKFSKDVQEGIDIAKQEFISEDDHSTRATAADLIREYMYAENLPKEAKLGVMKEMFDIIDNVADSENNRETAKIVVDTIRAEGDELIKPRLAALVAHELDYKYLPENADRGTMLDWATKVRSFEDILNDPTASKAQKAWAKFVLDSRGSVEVLSDLYEKDPWAEIVSGIPVEITDISTGGDANKVSPQGELMFTGNLFRLPPGRVPSLEKLQQFTQKTGRSLPVFMTRRDGGDFVHIEINPEDSAKLAGLAQDYRSGEISRATLMEEARKVEKNWFDQLDEVTKRALGDALQNIELRFSTERSTRKNEEEVTE